MIHMMIIYLLNPSPIIMVIVLYIVIYGMILYCKYRIYSLYIHMIYLQKHKKNCILFYIMYILLLLSMYSVKQSRLSNSASFPHHRTYIHTYTHTHIPTAYTHTHTYTQKILPKYFLPYFYLVRRHGQSRRGEAEAKNDIDNDIDNDNATIIAENQDFVL